MNKFVKGGLIVFVFNLLGIIASYLIRLIYSRSLSIQEYGLFFAGINFINIFLTYVDLGFGYAVTYLMPKYIKAKDSEKTWNIYKYGQIIQSVFSLIIFLLGLIFANWLATFYFKINSSYIFVYVLSFYFLINSLLNTVLHFYIGFQDEKFYSSLNAIKVSISIIFSVVLILFAKVNVLNYSLVWVVASFFTLLFYILMIRRKYSEVSKTKMVWNKEIFSEMYKLALPIIVSTAIYSFLAFGDIFLITLLRGVSEVGYYSIILTLASIPIFLFAPFNTQLLPLISHLMEGEKNEVSLILNTVFKIVPLVSVYFTIFLWLFSVSSIKFVFGSKWLGPTEDWLGPLSLAFVFFAMSNILGTITLGMGLVKEKLWLTVTVSVLSVVLNLILINLYGFKGAVLTNIFISALSVVLYVLMIIKNVSFKFPFIYYLKLGVIFMIIFISFKFFNLQILNFLQFISVGMLYTATFLLLALLLGLIDHKLIGKSFRVLKEVSGVKL